MRPVCCFCMFCHCVLSGWPCFVRPGTGGFSPLRLKILEWSRTWQTLRKAVLTARGLRCHWPCLSLRRRRWTGYDGDYFPVVLTDQCACWPLLDSDSWGSWRKVTSNWPYIGASHAWTRVRCDVYLLDKMYTHSGFLNTRLREFACD